MQVTTTQINKTKIKLNVTADAKILQTAKAESLKVLAKSVTLPGFRKGKAPLSLVEKHIDPQSLQTEFLERAINDVYVAVVEQENLRPVAQPNVSIKKFVPFDTLDIEFEVEVVGKLKLADYKKIKLPKSKVEVTSKDVNEVIKNLQVRSAEKLDVDRVAKNGDQVWIDFEGFDAKTNEVVNGADGKNYPLLLGSDTFIPGFESNLVGLKTNDEKEFVITFPKDYGVKALQNRDIKFKVSVLKVQEVVEPELNDEFASKVGPFKSVAELKDDIKKQLTNEKKQQSDRDYADKLLTEIADKSTVDIPEVLVDEQIQKIIDDQKQNLVYRGQTWKEFLEAEGMSEEEYKKSVRPNAELRVKAGLVLAEIAEAEKISVTPEELEIRMQLLKGQYKDPAMQAELDKPEARRDVASRIVSEKTINKLTEYAQSK